MSEKINIGDIVVTTKDCKHGNTNIPKGSYFIIGDWKPATFGLNLFHVKESNRIFSAREVELAKTFSLGDVVQHRGENYSIVKVFVKDNRLKYDMSAVKGATKIKGMDSTTIMNENKFPNPIKIGDTVMILKENDENHKHYRETMSVTRIHNVGGVISYELNGSQIVYGEKDIRLWEAKDEEIRIKIYKLSKTLRQNSYKLNDVHNDNEWCEETEKQIREHFFYLKKSYDKFINERIFTEETINILNTMYKEAKTKKQLIEFRMKEQKDV